MKSVLIKMREYNDTASPTEREIIHYVLTHAEEVVDLSIHELAAKSYSSSATILRLCRKLGLDGYRQFRLTISYELAWRKKSTEMEKKEITRMDSLEEIVEKITHKNIVSLEDSRELVDYATLEKCVTLLCSCKTVVLYGIGSSLFVAKDAYLKLLRLNKPCIVNDDWHTQLVQARNMTADDVGIVISYSGQTVEMLECIKAMRSNGVPVISITRYGMSPISRLSTYNLYVAANESIFRSGAMSSRISQLNLIDILYTAYASRTYDASVSTLSKTHIYKPGFTGIKNKEL